MLNVIGISKSFGIETVLEDVSFVINPGERAALVGPNGCGKSTLLKIIAGEMAADAGRIATPPTLRIGYLRQGMTPRPGQTVGQAVRAGLAGWDGARAEVDRLAGEMAETADLDRAMAAYDRAVTRFEALGGYGVEHRTEELLAHLGLDGIDPATPVAQLSGGEQTRAGLAAVLIGGPDLLLLDEPTNHLDIEALEWLESWLAAFDGAALIVSHDRTFLDRTVTRVLEIDERTHRLTEYAGSYSDYAAQRAATIEKQWAAWKDQQAEIRRQKQDIHRTMMHAQSVELTTTPRQPGVRRYAKKVAKKAKSREKKLERYVASDERVEKPDQHWEMNLDFGADLPRGGTEVIRLKGLGHHFDNGWLFREVTLTLYHGERIALLGPNGTGKSTLLKAVVGEINPAEGMVQIGAGMRIGYLPQKQDTLDPAATALSTVRDAAPLTETEVRNFLHNFLFAGDDVFVPVEKLSYGERSRLLLARLVARGANCLLLDEPLNHLDIPSRERFEAALAAFPGTVLATVHDRAFIDRFATGVWSLETGTVRRYLDRGEMLKARLTG